MDKAPKIIEASTASIATARVEIKTVTVSNKQMTLAVYRQLPKGKIAIEGVVFQVLGKAWGRINYHNADCPACRHIHVLYEHGGELYRDCVPADYNLQFEKLDIQVSEENLARLGLLQVVLWLHEQPQSTRVATCPLVSFNPCRVIAIGSKQTISVDCRFPCVIAEGLTVTSIEYLNIGFSAFRKLSNLGAFESLGDAIDDAIAKRNEAQKELIRVRDAWTAFYAELEALPQLFIAV